ncbi:MAG: glycosyltransferase family 2 protein [Lentisphaeria bacterium]|nr:glycosyltransferase family 2 protein [Lentisphaeria bacterium]
MKNLPSMTVVTPSFNQADTLERTIRSVLDQDYPNLEYIVMDGGSVDGSVDIIQKYAGQLTYWQAKPDGGQAAAINAGFAKGCGEIMAWLNSDDWYMPETLHKVGAFFSGNPESDWVSGIAEIVKPQGKHVRYVKPTACEIDDFAHWGQKMIFQPATFWTRRLWRQAGPLGEQWECAMDYDLWIRFCKHTRPSALPEVLAQSLQNKEIKTYRLAARTIVETGLSLDRNGYYEEAVRLLSRPIQRAVDMQRLFSPLTGSRLYRRWREKREVKRRPLSQGKESDQS